MLILVIVLLAVWLIVAIIGFTFHGLVWLAVIGVVLFLATAAISFVRRSAVRRR